MREKEPTYGFAAATNVLELRHITFDPLTSGFSGVVLELSENGGLFTLLEFSPITGNRTLRFTSRDEELVRNLFEAELEACETLQGLASASRA